MALIAQLVEHCTGDRPHVALIAQLVEHCTGNAKVVGSNPVQSLIFFSGQFSRSVMAAFASFILSLILIAVSMETVVV